MHPRGKVMDVSGDVAMPIYLAWLKEGQCGLRLYQEAESTVRVTASSGSRKYMASVPKARRKQHRW
jgi:hypothetical protein